MDPVSLPAVQMNHDIHHGVEIGALPDLYRVTHDVAPVSDAN